MVSFRGEEQSGFLDLVGTWLSQQSWFQAAPGRRVITRVGGLRLPAPEGDPDQWVHLELHIFHVDHAGGQARVAVPMALRSRPSALAGKTAFIGRLRAAEGDLWVYDGAHDRAFLAAWHEMARRGQGSRNGRSRGEAFAEFDTWPAFTAKLQRTPLTPPTPDATRTAVTIDGGDAETRKTVVDFFRQPTTSAQRPSTLCCACREPAAAPSPACSERSPEAGRRRTQPLGSASGSAEISASSVSPRSGGLPSPLWHGPPCTKAQTSSRRPPSWEEPSGDFHADLAGTFGAHPQTGAQLETMINEAAASLEEQRTQVRENLDETVPEELPEPSTV